VIHIFSEWRELSYHTGKVLFGVNKTFLWHMFVNLTSRIYRCINKTGQRKRQWQH